MVAYRRRSSVPRFRGPRVSPVRGGGGGRSNIESLARTLADRIIRERDAAAQRARLGRIYTQFDHHNDVLPNNIETVTRGLFAGNTGSLIHMFTSSLLTQTQKTYYQAIFSNGDPGVASSVNVNAELAMAYGHFNGSGSIDLTGNLNNDNPSRAIYRQYAQLLLAPNDKKFTINGVDTDHIYVLNFNRSRVREKLDPGNFELTLAELSGSVGFDINLTGGYNDGDFQDLGCHTGSNVRLSGRGYWSQVIDDSSLAAASVGESGQVYNLISGSIDGGTNIFQAADPIYFGLLYPQHGIAILNADTLDARVGFGTTTGSADNQPVQGDNAMKLFTSLSGSDAITPASLNGGIQARSAEQVKSTYYFVRVKNAEYNYSNNPTFVTGSLGELAYSTFIRDPQVYITTIGLYNERREMLAVAKLSQPLLKNFTREALVKVKLDF
jgi:hypothetical protein